MRGRARLLFAGLLVACVVSRAPRHENDSASTRALGDRACSDAIAAITPDTIIGPSDRVEGFHVLRTGPGPTYPADLRERHIGGYVEVSYTVDTLGTVVPGSELIETETHKEFGDSVCEYLRKIRFTPLLH